MEKWALLVGALLGTGGLAAILVVFFVPAPKRYDAALEAAGKQILDLQNRVTSLEKERNDSLSRADAEYGRRVRSNRERDAVCFQLDSTLAELKAASNVVASLAPTTDRTIATLLERWKNMPDSDLVLEGIPKDQS